MQLMLLHLPPVLAACAAVEVAVHAVVALLDYLGTVDATAQSAAAAAAVAVAAAAVAGTGAIGRGVAAHSAAVAAVVAAVAGSGAIGSTVAAHSAVAAAAAAACAAPNHAVAGPECQEQCQAHTVILALDPARAAHA